MGLLRAQLTATFCSTYGILFSPSFCPLWLLPSVPKLFQPQVACPVSSYANYKVFHFCQNCGYKRRSATNDVPPKKTLNSAVLTKLKLKLVSTF